MDKELGSGRGDRTKDDVASSLLSKILESYCKRQRIQIATCEVRRTDRKAAALEEIDPYSRLE